MPENETLERSRKDAREGKSPSTQAGEFVREEIHHIREGKHGARSPEQAIAIGLSKARRAGVKLPAPKKGRTSGETRRAAQRDLRNARRPAKRKGSRVRSRATTDALKREGHTAASRGALSKHAEKASARRSNKARHDSAIKATHTKDEEEKRAAARKAAETRANQYR